MIGKTISHYNIVEKLGEGGMGVVYRAEDTRLKRPVAVKFLPPSVTDGEIRKRFITEARAASSLEHPNICSIYEIDETSEGRMFIVMPCYQGETLRDRIGSGPMKINESLSLVMQIASGLSKAHQEGVIHRDIKPENILITADGLVKIVDFGVAKLSGGTRLTKTGTTIGTVGYMSPEQLQGKEEDHRVDIWALGIVFFEMLTGVLPFKGEYEQSAAYSIINEDPTPVRKLRPEISEQVEKIILKMLSRDPDDRYLTSGELIEELRSVKKRLDAEIAGPQLDEDGPAPSIAVLPFINMSSDPENQYFGDGLSEELINAFAQIEGLRVASRTSSFSFRGKDVDIREIGQTLKVNTLLEGSVRKAGNRLRITAQLINIEDGYHIWSKRFDREMEDIFEIQDEIARAIVEQLKVKLIGREDDKVMTFGTDNLEAYTALLEGRCHLHSLTPEGWEKGLALLNKSVQIDPGFALPHAWLSMFYQSLAWWGSSAPREVMPESRKAAEKALALDEQLGFAHINKAIVSFCYDWDFAAAEDEFKKGLALDPASGYGHMSHSLFYACRGRKEEAAVEGRTALKLEPLDGLIAAWVASCMLGTGELEEAIDISLRALDLGQEHWQLHMFLGQAYLQSGMYKNAEEANMRAIELSGGASVAQANMGILYYLTGRMSEGDRILELLLDRSEREYVSPTGLAYLEIARGNKEAARVQLERAVEARDLILVTDNMWPQQIRFRGSEFEPVLRSAGLL